MKPFKDSYQFDTIHLMGMDFPRVFFGTSPFIGAGQFGERAYDYIERFYKSPKNILDLMVQGIRMGCNAFQVIPYPPILDSVKGAVEKTGIEAYIFGTIGLGNMQEEIKTLIEAGAKCIVIHGSYTDRKIEDIENILSNLPGIITGVSTHLPGFTIEEASNLKGVKVILAPINKLGDFMRPSPQRTLKAIEGAREKGKVIVGMKVLAAGKLPPGEALEYIKDKVDGVAFGVTSREEMEEDLEQLRRYFGTEENS